MEQIRAGFVGLLGIIIPAAVAGCMGPPGEGGAGRDMPFELTPGESVTRMVAGGGGTFTATLQVEEGRTYGVAGASAGGTSFFDPFSGASGPAIELKVSGDPLRQDIIIRSFFQTPGLTLFPDEYFTAESDGTVTFRFVNATRNSSQGGVLGGLAGIAFGGSTAVEFELLVTDEGTEGIPESGDGFNSLFDLFQRK